jgi:hypothetical protein
VYGNLFLPKKFICETRNSLIADVTLAKSLSEALLDVPARAARSAEAALEPLVSFYDHLLAEGISEYESKFRQHLANNDHWSEIFPKLEAITL